MKHLITLALIILCRTAFSQGTVDQYDDFNGLVTYGKDEKALALGEKILPQVSSLSARQQAIFYYKLAGLYETGKSDEQAIVFYERSLKIEPDFYVPHLALGYLYLARVNVLARQLNAEKNNSQLHQEYKVAYNLHLRKALSYLEKAMACDPNEEALLIIRNGYQTLKDPASLSSLDLRLKELAKNCKTVLAED